MADETMSPSQARGNVQNWANKAAGKPQLDIDIPAEEQGVYDFMDKYYPNFSDEHNKVTYGYNDFLNDKTSNYSDRVGKFHDTHKGTMRNELQRIHPDWNDELLNDNTEKMYNRWVTSKDDGVTPAQNKASSVMNWEDAKNRMANDVQNVRKWQMEHPSYKTPEELAGISKDYYDQEKANAIDRKNALQNIQNTVKNTGKSEMENFTDSLNDYMTKNKKGRDDIPVTTRR